MNDIPSLPGTGPYGELTYNHTTTHRQRLRPVLIYFLNPHHNSSQLSPRSMAARLSLCGSDCWVHVIRTISMSGPRPCTLDLPIIPRITSFCRPSARLRSERACVLTFSGVAKSTDLLLEIAALNTSVRTPASDVSISPPLLCWLQAVSPLPRATPTAHPSCIYETLDVQVT